MKLYKKILPYVLAAAPLSNTSCLVDSITEKGVVVKIDDNGWYYCDKDSDKLADYRFYIKITRGGTDCVRDYIQVGDTVTFNYYSGGDITGCSYSMPFTDVKSVNNRSVEELRKIQGINKIRTAAGQPKMR